MPRHLPTYWPDEPQHESHPDEELYWRDLVPGMDEVHPNVPTHCPFCSKPLDARLLCHACGDADDEEEREAA